MEEAPFYRDTWVEVDLDAIYNNVTHIKEFIPSDVEILPLLKGMHMGTIMYRWLK